jgi:hypothetical protein
VQLLKSKNLEEFNMGMPKRKTDLQIYRGKELTERRQELLDRITKADTFLPDTILHDDLDSGMLDYVKKEFQVVSDGAKIPVIPKILTIQRWAQLTNTWEFSDTDGNMKVPFVGVIRRPDVQPGTNPSVIRTVPDRHQFHYATVPTWNGTQMGADVYKIPQPIAVDITYDVTIVCTKIRELNKFNKIVMQNFASRQDYTTVKGHYIPIVMDKIEDNSPIDQIDGRRFYLQTYQFTMLGFLIDQDEFEVKPAISRLFLLNEFAKNTNYQKKYINKTINLTIATFKADGLQTAFSVGESIGILFSVAINGLLQERDFDFYHIAGTSKISFVVAPLESSVITITYYKGRNSVFIDNYGKPIQVNTEYFEYDGSTLIFQVLSAINSVVSFDINGLVEEEGSGFDIISNTEIQLNYTPVVGSKIGVTYLF